MQSKIDSRWRWCRIPIAIAGFGVLMWGAITGYVFSIIWGVVMMVVIPIFVKRFDGCCCTPGKFVMNVLTTFDNIDD